MSNLNGLNKLNVSRILDSFTVTTRAHADEFNSRLQVLLDNDVTLEEQTFDSIQNLRQNMLDLVIETEMLKKAHLTGVDANMFVETFLDTNDIILVGYFDAATNTVKLR